MSLGLVLADYQCAILQFDAANGDKASSTDNLVDYDWASFANWYFGENTRPTYLGDLSLLLGKMGEEQKRLVGEHYYDEGDDWEEGDEIRLHLRLVDRMDLLLGCIPLRPSSTLASFVEADIMTTGSMLVLYVPKQYVSSAGSPRKQVTSKDKNQQTRADPVKFSSSLHVMAVPSKWKVKQLVRQVCKKNNIPYKSWYKVAFLSGARITSDDYDGVSLAEVRGAPKAEKGKKAKSFAARPNYAISEGVGLSENGGIDLIRLNKVIRMFTECFTPISIYDLPVFSDIQFSMDNSMSDIAVPSTRASIAVRRRKLASLLLRHIGGECSRESAVASTIEAPTITPTPGRASVQVLIPGRASVQVLPPAINKVKALSRLLGIRSNVKPVVEVTGTISQDVTADHMGENRDGGPASEAVGPTRADTSATASSPDVNKVSTRTKWTKIAKVPPPSNKSTREKLTTSLDSTRALPVVNEGDPAPSMEKVTDSSNTEVESKSTSTPTTQMKTVEGLIERVAEGSPLDFSDLPPLKLGLERTGDRTLNDVDIGISVIREKTSGSALMEQLGEGLGLQLSLFLSLGDLIDSNPKIDDPGASTLHASFSGI